MIFAPPAWADRFDEHGCVIPAAWENKIIPLVTEQVQVADSPADQRADVPSSGFAFDGVSQKLHPEFDQRVFIFGRFGDFMAGT